MESISKWYRQVFYKMDLQSAFEVLTHYQTVFWIMLIGYITHWLPEKNKNQIEVIYNNSPFALKIVVGVVVGVLCYQVFSSDIQPFIYFQF